MSLHEVIATGDLLKSLEGIRDQIAVDLDACESMRDRVALYLRLESVLARIEEAKPDAKGDVVDEIAARRSARRSGDGPDSSRSGKSS